MKVTKLPAYDAINGRYIDPKYNKTVKRKARTTKKTAMKQKIRQKHIQAYYHKQRLIENELAWLLYE